MEQGEALIPPGPAHAEAVVPALPLSSQQQQHVLPRLSSGGFRLTFTQGLLVGQLSIILLAIVFIRYFIFEDVNTALEKEKQAVRTSSSECTPAAC